MATKKKARKPEPEPRQSFLPDMEPPSITAIDEAAEQYVEARDSRMKMLTTEMENHQSLLDLMHEHGLSTYEFDGYTVNINAVEKVKVKKKKEPDIDLGTDIDEE